MKADCWVFQACDSFGRSQQGLRTCVSNTSPGDAALPILEAFTDNQCFRAGQGGGQTAGSPQAHFEISILLCPWLNPHSGRRLFLNLINSGQQS